MCNALYKRKAIMLWHPPEKKTHEIIIRAYIYKEARHAFHGHKDRHRSLVDMS